ncbi:MAG TPA: hypothetical protein VK603_01035 [Candidatus Saccharimonadales bacterium]|nr:hypothetical protein [Candidatus Saccharimonadales bacterium]
MMKPTVLAIAVVLLPTATLSSPSGAVANFKVQDGLIFNAVRYGDQVEITVENIEGAKTIVGLR